MITIVTMYYHYYYHYESMKTERDRTNYRPGYELTTERYRTTTSNHIIITDRTRRVAVRSPARPEPDAYGPCYSYVYIYIYIYIYTYIHSIVLIIRIDMLYIYIYTHI